mgnify:CR=1 FL=1
MTPRHVSPTEPALSPRSQALVVATPGGQVLWANREARALAGNDRAALGADGLGGLLQRLEGGPAFVGARSLRATRLTAWRTHAGQRVALTLTPLDAPEGGRALGAILTVDRAPEEAPRRAGRQRTRAAALTAREGEVLALIAGGAKTPGVARALGLSQRTVHAHVRSLFAKLGVSGRLALVARAREAGLVD